MRVRAGMLSPLVLGAAVCFGTLGTSSPALAEPVLENPKVDTPKKWQDAFNKKDVAGVLSHLTNSVVWITETGILRGKAEVEKQLEGGLKAGIHDEVIDSVDEMVSGDNAKADGIWAFKMPGKNGEDITLKGYWSASYVKSDGEWKLNQLTTNTTPPAQ